MHSCHRQWNHGIIRIRVKASTGHSLKTLLNKRLELELEDHLHLKERQIAAMCPARKTNQQDMAIMIEHPTAAIAEEAVTVAVG